MDDSTRARLSQIQVISFDLDDTLWDCEPVILRAEQAIYGWLQKHAPRITDHCTAEDLHSHRIEFAQGHPEYRVDVTYLRKASLKSLFAQYDYPIDLADEAFALFYQVRSQVDLYKDACQVLESLKLDYKIAALTNGNADLTLIGIDHLFDDIQLASLSNPPKPDKAMFNKTAAALGVETEHILHVGDNPGTDVEGGRNAGTMTVWFNQHGVEWPDHYQPADIEIDNLTVLTEIMRNR